MKTKGLNETMPNPAQGGSEGRSITILRTVSMVALIVGATGSLIFMIRAGQHTPRFLLVLFTLWVLAPFAALLWATMASRRWSALTRWTLYWVTLIVALSSLAIYGEWINLKPAGSANAFLWVIVPPVSLIFTAIAVWIAAIISRGQSRSSN